MPKHVDTLAVRVPNLTNNFVQPTALKYVVASSWKQNVKQYCSSETIVDRFPFVKTASLESFNKVFEVFIEFSN